MKHEDTPAVARVTFRHAPHEDAIEALCHEQTSKLLRVYDRISMCHVIIDNNAPKRNTPPEISLTLHLPGHEIAAHDHSRDPGSDTASAVRRTFAAATRQLNDHLERRQKSRTHGSQADIQDDTQDDDSAPGSDQT